MSNNFSPVTFVITSNEQLQLLQALMNSATFTEASMPGNLSLMEPEPLLPSFPSVPLPLPSPSTCSVPSMFSPVVLPMSMEPSEDGDRATGSRSKVLLDKLEQSGKVPSKEKFRRMICNTFLCCGGCPYVERCVFLHDRRLENRVYKSRPTKQVKSSNGVKDTFYWPDMRKDHIYQRLDQLGLPDVNQAYLIPAHFGTPAADMHERAMFSIWSHFVDFCMRNSWDNGPKQFSRQDLCEEDNPNDSNNKFVPGVKRLNVFVKLASNLPVIPQTPPVKSTPEDSFLAPTPSKISSMLSPRSITFDWLEWMSGARSDEYDYQD